MYEGPELLSGFDMRKLNQTDIKSRIGSFMAGRAFAR